MNSNTDAAKAPSGKSTKQKSNKVGNKADNLLNISYYSNTPGTGGTENGHDKIDLYKEAPKWKIL